MYSVIAHDNWIADIYTLHGSLYINADLFFLNHLIAFANGVARDRSTATNINCCSMIPRNVRMCLYRPFWKKNATLLLIRNFVPNEFLYAYLLNHARHLRIAKIN